MPSPLLRLAAVAAVAYSAAVCVAQTVAPPPRPIGSRHARPMAGLQEPERKRFVRAHHHRFQHKKDYTRDDSVYGPESRQAGNGPAPRGNGNGNGNGNGRQR